MFSSLLSWFPPPLFSPSAWGLLQSSRWSLSQTPPLTDKIALITGGTSGIGAEIVLQLLQHDIKHVYVLARSAARFDDTMDCYWLPRLASIGYEGRTSRVSFVQCDMSDLRQTDAVVRELCRRLERLDILFLNAALSISTPLSFTSAGVETTFTANHLGGFLLTKRLLPLLRHARDHTGLGTGRIIVTSSSLHMLAPRIDYGELSGAARPFRPSTWEALHRYARSKLANILFVQELATRLRREHCDSVLINAFFPGNVATPAMGAWCELLGDTLGGAMRWLVETAGQSLEDGAATAVFLATSVGLEGNSGRYWIPVASKGEVSSVAEDHEEARKLWEWSEEVIARSCKRTWFS